MTPSAIDSALASGLGNPTARERFGDDCCVVTGACKKYFPGIQVLYASLVAMHTNVKLLAFDVGWTRSQRAWANAQPGITVVDAGPIVDGFDPTWLKPNFIMSAAEQYARVIWIDADCVVRIPVTAVFNHIKSQPLIIKNQFCTPNDRGAYLLPGFERCLTKEDFAITAGVIAIESVRDYEILREWVEMTRSAIDNNGMHLFSGMRDEGVLRAVVQKMNLFDSIWWDMRWNAIHHDPATRGSIVDSLLTLRAGDYITHFFGLPKPWWSAGLEVLDVNPHWRYSHE